MLNIMVYEVPTEAGRDISYWKGWMASVSGGRYSAFEKWVHTRRNQISSSAETDESM